MKKSLPMFLCFVIVTAATVSCSKNDPAPPNTSDAMVGHWEIETFSHTDYSSTDGEYPYNPYDCLEKSFLDLKPAGVVQMGDVDQNCVLNKSDGTWTANYGVLQFDNGLRYRIVSVTASKLILKYDLSSNGQQYYTYTLLKK